MMLQDRVAVVTGAGRGIGRAIVLTLAEQGADQVIIDIDLENARKVAQEVESVGRKALVIEADVTQLDQVEAMTAQTLEEFDRIDILVNNAGVYEHALVAEMPDAEWDRTLDINLKGAFLCTRAALKPMMTQQSGRIISISSIAAYRGSITHAHYSAAKAGVVGFTKALALELGPYGITVNAIAPGVIEGTFVGESAKQHLGEGYAQTIPMRRYGRPEDVAHGVAFLASDGADYITGQVLHINGGLLMP
ncbi:MAG: SDR family NAD(P)-dependent oxidoreductase [Candidatus Bipolaricaulia bacterium]